MARTLINGPEGISTGTLTRALLNTTTAASAVIAKVVAGTNITLTSTGVDAGTGDVTINATTFVGMTTDFVFVLDGGGSAITTGIKGDIEVPFACTISQVTLLADQSGSIVIDIWKAAYASFPPVVGGTITASALPTISAALKALRTS